MQDITHEHNINQSQIVAVLNQMESQVSRLKNTRESLSENYEFQLDLAVKEMYNFYAGLETAKSGDNTSRLDLDRVFFIRPTEEIQKRLQQHGMSQIQNGIS